MGIFLSILISAIEMITIFMLIFALFRHRSNWMHLLHIGLFGIILAFLSYILREKLDMTSYDTPIQFFLIFLFIRVIYKMKWMNIGIVLLFGFILYTLLQTVVLLCLQRLQLFALSDANTPSSFGAILLQIVSIAWGLIVAWMMKYKNLGFSFISFHSLISYKDHDEKKLAIAVIITGCAFLVSVVSVFISSNLLTYFTFPVTVISFINLIRLSYAKEITD